MTREAQRHVLGDVPEDLHNDGALPEEERDVTCEHSVEIFRSLWASTRGNTGAQGGPTETGCRAQQEHRHRPLLLHVCQYHSTRFPEAHRRGARA